MENKLKEFIIYARAETYASGRGPKIDRGKTYFLIKEGLEYQDIYYDQEKVFQGQEVIFSNGRAIWSFSYRGIVNDDSSSNEVFFFLKKSLLNQISKARSYTTCRMASEKWKYSCEGIGNFEDFSGEETIYFENTPVYLMKYFAGVIK
ncbi:MAG: DUF5680 domain-containing protein [Rhabdochlamydiaceae bacterium]